MSETAYCYHCGRPHPKEEMRQIHTKSGSRWRCIKSIAATKQGVAARDAFGRQVSAMNSTKQSQIAKAALTGNLPSD
jgi:hypothetical protein